MRIFEVVLILVNLLILMLSFKKRSKAVWLGIVGVNIFVFFLHDVFEGLRYQMAFSYTFVNLITVYTLIQAFFRLEVRIPKVLKIIAVSLSFVLLVLTALLAYALPVFTLPKPTGNYAVGIQYFHLIDENRMDPFLDKSPQKRELMIKMYYPARQDNTKPFSPYFHSPQLVKSFTAFHGMPDFLFDQLNL